jgi:hypothetical protein
MGVLTGVQKVEYPSDTSSQINFDEVIQIRWPKVKGFAFHLCVGTTPGQWDILSADVGKRKQQLFDLSDVPKDVRSVYVQLITIADPMDEDDDGAVGEVIEITREGA